MAAGAGARARARLCVRAPPECSPRAWRPRLCPGARPARGGRAWSRRVAQPGMETPLDVLSRAASLVHADDEKRLPNSHITHPDDVKFLVKVMFNQAPAPLIRKWRQREIMKPVQDYNTELLITEGTPVDAADTENQLEIKVEEPEDATTILFLLHSFLLYLSKMVSLT
ncbi:uncharacterized protein LOC144373238 isoform X2 [Ictidomys tridecemlineatus]